MVTRIRKGARGHLYIREWMEFRGLSVQRLAERLEMPRESVNRWIKEQNRLDPAKITQLADALGCEPWELWRPPSSRASLDALAAGIADDATHGVVVDLVKKLAAGGRQ